MRLVTREVSIAAVADGSCLLACISRRSCVRTKNSRSRVPELGSNKGPSLMRCGLPAYRTGPQAFLVGGSLRSPPASFYVSNKCTRQSLKDLQRCSSLSVGLLHSLGTSAKRGVQAGTRSPSMAYPAKCSMAQSHPCRAGFFLFERFIAVGLLLIAFTSMDWKPRPLCSAPMELPPHGKSQILAKSLPPRCCYQSRSSTDIALLQGKARRCVDAR